VNVHPMKIEVRFQDEWRVYQALKSAVAEVLQALLETIPSLERFASRGAFPPPGTATEQPPLALKTLPAGARPGGAQTPELERARQYVVTLTSRDATPEGVEVELIWQVHNKYILSQINSGLVVIDQHVAHERVLFEEALEAFQATPLAAQTLLFPQVLEFSPVDYESSWISSPFWKRSAFA